MFKRLGAVSLVLVTGELNPHQADTSKSVNVTTSHNPYVTRCQRALTLIHLSHFKEAEF